MALSISQGLVNRHRTLKATARAKKVIIFQMLLIWSGITCHVALVALQILLQMQKNTDCFLVGLSSQR